MVSACLCMSLLKSARPSRQTCLMTCNTLYLTLCWFRFNRPSKKSSTSLQASWEMSVILLISLNI